MATESSTSSDNAPTNTVSTRLPSVSRLGTHVALIVALVLMALPLVLAVVMSTETTNQIYSGTVFRIGSHAIGNYHGALFEYGMVHYLLNSLVMSVLVVVGKIAISLLAALALVYYEFRFERAVFLLILFTLMLPVPVRILSLFNMLAALHLTDTLAAVTLPYLASATVVFLLRQHFRSLPDSLAESARLDNVGPLTFLIRVLIPLSKGMLAGVTVIEFIYAWNQYLWPLVVIQHQSNQLIQVGVKNLQSAGSAGQTQWGLIMAGAVIALLPPLVVLVALRKPLLNTFGVSIE